MFRSVVALARRVSENTNSSKQPAEADLNKKKNIRKAKGGLKVTFARLATHTHTYICF